MDTKTLSNNREYLLSPKTNTYRRRSKSLGDKEEKEGTHNHVRHHSPPPKHAHHQPVMKFNSDMWMQEFRQSVIKKLFKEERFKDFQKRRNLDSIMDISDDEEWAEQQKIIPVVIAAPDLIRSVVQNEWANYSAFSSEYRQWLQQSQIGTSPMEVQQLQQQHEAFINSLPSEIAQAVATKNLPSD
ncbi:1223_t:CDS:2, partial [Acaulospora colombiana]